MRFDILDQLSDQQVLAGSGAQVSTNSKQKGLATQDLGIGCGDMGIIFAVDQGALAGTGTDLTLEMIEATDGALTTSITQLIAVTIPKASFIDGSSFFLELPGYLMAKEFFGARYTPVGGTITGAINAYWGSRADFAKFKSFATPYNVQNN